MKWQELSGEERYRIVELARKREVSIQELCRTFGVSRQTLYRTIDAADRAAIRELEPKKRGRKRRPESELKREALESEKATLEQQLARWRQKYEVAKTILDLQRRAERGERLPGEEGKKSRADRESQSR